MVGGRERRLSCWHPGLMRHSTSLVNSVAQPSLAGEGHAGPALQAMESVCCGNNEDYGLNHDKNQTLWKLITMKSNLDENLAHTLRVQTLPLPPSLVLTHPSLSSRQPWMRAEAHTRAG